MSVTNTAEVAGLMFKLERAESELAQVRLDMERFREEARVARHQLSLTEKALEESELKQTEQSKRISELEKEVTAYESLKQRSQTAVAGLQKVARESQDHVIKLETRLRQLLEQQDNTKQTASQENSENQRFMQQVARRLGILKATLDGSEILETLGQRLDTAALLEVQHAQTETQLNKALRDLEAIQASTEQLTKRYEENLTDRKILGEKLGTRDAEMSDLSSQIQLLQASVRAKDKQLADLRKQLQDLTVATQAEKERTRKTVFELEMEKVQLKSLVDFLAASLSTVDQPCPATEAAVKQAVQKLLEQTKMLKEAGSGFEQKVLQLQRQFESQMKSGILATEELKTTRQRMREMESDKAQMETELLGMRLLVQTENHGKTQFTELLGKLVQRLGFQLDDSEKPNIELLIYALDGLERLLARGCLSQSCLERNFQPDFNAAERHSPSVSEPHHPVHQHSHANHTHCASPNRTRPAPMNQDLGSFACDHQSLPQLIGAVLRNQGRLDNDQERMIRHLCDRCAQALTLALCSQLHEVCAQLKELRASAVHIHSGQEPHSVANHEAVIRLQMDYEAEHAKVLALTRKIAELEQAKKTEIDELNETVDRLEKSRRIQAKKLDKISRQNDKENADTLHKLDALKTTKQLLVETQRRKARLSDYFALLGRLINVDTRFEPNAEALILHRVQQMVELVHRSGLVTTLVQANTVPVWSMPSGLWSNGITTSKPMGTYTATPPPVQLPALQNGDFDGRRSLSQLESRVSFEEIQPDGTPPRPTGKNITENQRTRRSHSACLGRRRNTSSSGAVTAPALAKSVTAQPRLQMQPIQRPKAMKRDDRKY